MSSHANDPAPSLQSFYQPRNLIAAALALAALAAALAFLLPDRAIPVRVGLIVAGLLLALGAVNMRLRAGLRAPEQRAGAAVTLALAALVPLLGTLACHEDWDSFRLLLGVLLGAGLAGAVLCLLPQAVRRAILLLLVVVHFGGILTAVFSVPPPNSPGPWLSNALWGVFYRPYLQFAYLNNAYHFYSPEPGPATLLWFRVQYADGSARWVKLPNREDYPTRVQYQRRLALAESTNQSAPSPPPGQFEQVLFRRNFEAARMQHPIPLHPELTPANQYREPNPYSKAMLSTFARHVATNPAYAHEKDPTQPVTGVKVYRVIHNIVPARELSRGLDPRDEVLYTPYYMGEFDSDGKLKNPNDPFLYWLIPILRTPKPDATALVAPATPGDYVLRNYLAYHAGDATQP